MIDLHTHLLPDIDDGSHSMHASVETLKMLHAQGCDTVICSPHISSSYPNSEADIRRKYDELCRALAKESLDMTLYYGAEYSCETVCEKIVQNDPIVFINAANESKKYVLVEFPFMRKPFWLDKMVDRMTRDTIGIIVAHPERSHNQSIFTDITRHGDCIFAINGSSILGDDGAQVKRNAFSLISQHCERIIFASDAHPALGRYPQFDAIIEQLQKQYSHVMIDYWFHTLPDMIVFGKQISEAEKNMIHVYASTMPKMEKSQRKSTFY